MNLTINELSCRTGISAYEIRRRVHNGTLPHMRVGAKQTKILIDEDIFHRLLMEESHSNMVLKHRPIASKPSYADNTTGYGMLRKID